MSLSSLFNFWTAVDLLIYIVNAAQVHHVYIFDETNVCRFAGFVGWIHTQNLKDAIAEIENTWC